MAVVAWVQHEQDPGVALPGADPGRPGGAAASLVHQLERAVRDGDPDTVTSFAAPSGQEQLSAVVSNARALGVRDFSLRYVDGAGGPRPDDSWTGVVDLEWRLGRDDEPSRVELAVEFVPTAHGLRIGGIGGLDGLGARGRRTPLWLAGSVQVARSRDVLVLSRSAMLPARRVLDRATRAVAEVGAVLRGRTGPVVVEVAATAAELDEALGTRAGDHEQIAAVTTSVDGVGGPVHVFVNPEVTGTLGPQAAQVVMTHEIVHVVTTDAEQRVTVWLSEGLADYVALRDVALPPAVTASRALRVVRRGGVPSALPGRSEFAPDHPHLQASYELAWLACVVVAQRLGEEALLELHTAVASGSSVADALAAAGWSRHGLLTAWQDRLEALASGPAG